MSEYNVIVHTMPDCIHCERAKTFLVEKGIPFEIVDHPEKADRLALYQIFDRKSMPIVFLNEDCIGGADDLVISGIESLFPKIEVSTNAELKEHLQGLGLRIYPTPSLSSDESIPVVLHRIGTLDYGVSVARRLMAAGMTLKQAHDTINRLASRSWTICHVAKTEDLRRLANDLMSLNVELRLRRPIIEQGTEIAEMRTRCGLSQRQYADILGLNVRTLQDWEQGRNPPDPVAVNLMRIFDCPQAPVWGVLTEPVGIDEDNDVSMVAGQGVDCEGDE